MKVCEIGISAEWAAALAAIFSAVAAGLSVLVMVCNRRAAKRTDQLLALANFGLTYSKSTNEFQQRACTRVSIAFDKSVPVKDALRNLYIQKDHTSAQKVIDEMYENLKLDANATPPAYMGIWVAK